LFPSGKHDCQHCMRWLLSAGCDHEAFLTGIFRVQHLQGCGFPTDQKQDAALDQKVEGQSLEFRITALKCVFTIVESILLSCVLTSQDERERERLNHFQAAEIKLVAPSRRDQRKEPSTTPRSAQKPRNQSLFRCHPVQWNRGRHEGRLV
jgi:hypothetical protein